LQSAILIASGQVRKSWIQSGKSRASLYRYAPSGTYYGLIRSGGKQIRRSLDINDLPLARRKLQELRRGIALTDHVWSLEEVIVLLDA
jgi:hypothetical protein